MDVRSALRSSRQLKGIFCLIVAGAILAFTDGMSKFLTGSFPPGEILFFRSIFVFIPISIMVWRSGGVRAVRIVNWNGQIARGLFAVVTSFMFMVAIKHMPLADITAVMFASPIILTALAPYFLGEQVGWRRWTAVAVGFGGTLMMIRPGGDTLLWPSLLALGATFLICFRDIATRRLSKTDNANSIMICTTACVMLGGLSSALFGWRTPDLEALGLFMLTGILQGTGQYFLVSAFLYGEAVVVAPFRYFTLIWATLYGYLMFGDIPGLNTLLGAAIVIGSGLFIFYREAKIHR
ncbi:MAG: EamA family transporter [Alphaproteobacteria bacterium]|nr:EamA family transporter [Alphaproteobacteria bacterium]